VFNLGAGEVLVILLLALIVLGPQRLPDAAKQVGRFTGELKRLSSGFQAEVKSAFDAETESSARAKGAALSGRDAVSNEAVDASGPTDVEGAVDAPVAGDDAADDADGTTP
jgi:sec-independent protein translocase protein TatB